LTAVRTVGALALACGITLLATGYTTRGGASAIPLPGAKVATQPARCRGYDTYAVPRVAPLAPYLAYVATITTNKGSFTIKLLVKEAPVTVQNFIYLAERGYFDGVPFHRVIPGFVIQGGDPSGTGLCGPGYVFKDENLGQSYRRGTVAMANAGPNTNGSQFFVVLANNTVLNQEAYYSIFGKVTSGMDTIDRLTSVQLGPGADGTNSSPLTKIYMKSVRVTES